MLSNLKIEMDAVHITEGCQNGSVRSVQQLPIVKVTVSERALFARIDRKLLRQSGERLARCRSNSRWFNDLGNYYSYESQSRFLRGAHHDLEELGRELGVLRSFEEVQG